MEALGHTVAEEAGQLPGVLLSGRRYVAARGMHGRESVICPEQGMLGTCKYSPSVHFQKEFYQEVKERLLLLERNFQSLKSKLPPWS